MYPRLQAEEQTARITAARVAQGAADAKGKQAIEQYEAQLEQQRTGGQTAKERGPVSAKARKLGAIALGLSVGKPQPVKPKE